MREIGTLVCGTTESGIMNIYAEHLAEGVDIETVKGMVEAETWLNGTQAAEYFRVKVGEENTIAAAVQDYTKLYCHNTPGEILKPESAAGQQDTGEQDRRKEIVSLAMEYMTR